jgi:hypothetical protein
MNTAGTDQWPQRSMACVILRWDTSHDPAAHHRATPSANTMTVTATSSGRLVRKTGV